MPTLHIYWDDRAGKWPPTSSGRRWTDEELDDLQKQLNRVGLGQVSDAIGSLRIDKYELTFLLHK